MNVRTEEKFSVGCFALIHGLIDLASTLVVYNAAIVHGLSPDKAISLIIAYDIIAFALQPLAGFFIDHTKSARIAMLIGVVLTLTGVILMRSNAIIAIVSVGIGNSLFHVGAGAQILGRYQNSTSAIGIFVGPGALGLSIGFWFGSHGVFPLWTLIVSFGVATIGLAFLPEMVIRPLQSNRAILNARSQSLIVLLLLIAIMIRGFIGRIGFSGLPTDAVAIIGLGTAACIGKMAGGVFADRLGWSRTTIAGLVLASVGIVFVHNHIWIAFATMLFFQTTMPITLIAASVALPGKPAFAFGLTCLALVSGTLPAFYTPQFFSQLLFTLTMIGVSGICILVALRKMGYWGHPAP
jgi:FSR family fosmidomycin resistance protein-like MFS transporter